MKSTDRDCEPGEGPSRGIFLTSFFFLPHDWQHHHFGLLTHCIAFWTATHCRRRRFLEMAPLVDSSQIKHAELLRPLPFQFRAYVWPFIIIWPIFLRYYITPDLYETYIGAPEWTFVWCGAIITLQSLVWLSTHWSVAFDARFKATKVNSVEEALLIKVLPIANAGSAEICKIVRDKVRFSSIAGSPVRFRRPLC